MTVVPSRRWRAWPTFLDGACDAAVVAFALWTIWYQVALAAQFDLRPSGWPFFAMALLVMVLGGMRAIRTSGEGDPGSGIDSSKSAQTAPQFVPPRPRQLLVMAGLVVLLVSTVVVREACGVLPIALVAIALLLTVATVTAPHRSGASDQPVVVAIPLWEHGVAVATSAGLGVLALLIVKSDADDVYYVNRAAWVAEHGNAQLKDTMFGEGNHPLSFGGGLPTPSFEAWQGVLAAMLHIEAASAAYLVCAPLFAAAFGWATWRLVRAWAPRRLLLVFGVAVLFVLANGTAVVGNYSIGRIWQGKVVAYAVLLPLLWVYLSRLLRRPSREDWILLLAGGVTFVGLTTSASLMGPMVVGSALLAAWFCRSRALAVGAGALMIGPVLNGVAQLFGSATLGEQLASVTGSERVFAMAFGTSTPLVALAVVGTATAVGTVRKPSAVLAGAVGLLTLAVFLPGMLNLAATVTGAGAVVWRLPIVAPTAVMVGLIAAASPIRLRRGHRQTTIRLINVMVAASVVLAMVLPLVGGRWLWSGDLGARISSTPAWKVDPDALKDVRLARGLDVPAGLWLMPPVQMQNLAISTTGPYAVVPLLAYLPALDVSKQSLSDRRMLYALVDGQPLPSPAVLRVRGALTRLNVSLACVDGAARKQRRVLRAAVDAALVKVGSMRCSIASR